MTIAPEWIEQLSKPLAKLYRNEDLEPLMLTLTGDGLYESWVGTGMPARQTIQKLLEAVNREGIGDLVLGEMLARKPFATELHAMVEIAAPTALLRRAHNDMALSLQHGGAMVQGGPDNAFAPGLQKNVRPNLHSLDLQVWLDKLVEARNRVCRIEIGPNAAGTGFLVGPRAVLTNWHVVEQAQAAGLLGKLVCRFDYLRRSDGSRQAGVTVALGSSGIVAHAPCSDAERTDTPDFPEPTADELDFALLHLDQAAGRHAVDSGLRGWFRLPEQGIAPKTDAPLLIVQHPDGAPMKLAMDTQSVIGANGNGTRVRHRTNTDNGSSGSPCFSMDWDPVLLHHFGDPAWGNPKFNQGVPLWLVRASIADAGHAALLTG
jgi:Trypsin-like peptidase domain